MSFDGFIRIVRFPNSIGNNREAFLVLFSTRVDQNILVEWVNMPEHT